MKYLLLTENWPPRIGGIEKYLSGLAWGLQKSGKTVEVVAPKARGSEAPVLGIAAIRKRFFYPILKPSWLALFIFLWRKIKREGDVTLLCGKALFEGLIGHYLKKYLGTKYVVFTYGMEINHWKSVPYITRKLVRSLTNADAVIVINKEIQSTLVELGVSKDRIHTIYPAIDPDFSKRIASNSNNSGVLEKHNIKKPYILSVGRFVPRKGFDDLIEAFAKLDQVKHESVQLVIAGDGPDRKRIEKIAEAEYVRPVFVGAVSDDELAVLYSNANMFALTPKNDNGDIEGYGIVYLEAAAAGLPIVATKTGGVPEALTGIPRSTMVAPGDIQAISSALADSLVLDSRSAYTPTDYTARAKQLLDVAGKLV